MKLGGPVRLPAATAPALRVALLHVDPAGLKTAGSLVVLLAAGVTTAAGLTVAVGRLRLRPHRPPVRAVHLPPGPAAGITTAQEGPARPERQPTALAPDRDDPAAHRHGPG
jgi:hypothetical protein